MTTLQKIIKYLAIAFAVFLIVNIISGILLGINALSNVLGLSKSNIQETKHLDEIAVNIQESEIETLKIELKSTNLEIKKGEAFKVESDNSNILCTQNKKQLKIEEKNHNWFMGNDTKDLIIYIPENMTFDEIKIEAGAGEINIEKLETKELAFEIGAGKVEIQELNVLKKAQIDGGAGKVDILSGEINNLDLDMGIGEFILKSKLSGKSDIDAGVGKLEIDLMDDIENYCIKASKGIGRILIDGKDIAEDREYGNGENYIKVDGAIGDIEIK